MKHRAALFAAIASLAVTGIALADATPLDLDQLRYDTVHEVARRAVLAVDGEGRPVTFLLRIANGQFLPPHGGAGPLRILTVVTGTLSWGDGRQVSEAVEHRYGPGSVIVIPASGGVHWAAARDGDVLLQVVVVRDGKLAPAAAAQPER